MNFESVPPTESTCWMTFTSMNTMVIEKWTFKCLTRRMLFKCLVRYPLTLKEASQDGQSNLFSTVPFLVVVIFNINIVCFSSSGNDYRFVNI